jgi:hypothetical protein
MTMRRKLGKLARRYGHSAMKSVEETTASIRKMAHDNPTVTAAAAGAGLGALAAGMGIGTAALLGGAVAVGAEKLMTK